MSDSAINIVQSICNSASLVHPQFQVIIFHYVKVQIMYNYQIISH